MTEAQEGSGTGTKDAGYLLSIRELAKQEADSPLWRQVCERLDEERLNRARSIRTAEKRAACAGAGLLLQWALQQKGGKGWKTENIADILEGMQKPIPLGYIYNSKGKPYLRDSSLFFNLSHSGEYVVCVLSKCEIGVDIQRQMKTDCTSLAGRFYHPHERELLAAISGEEERRDFFYRLWTRKEAYGKMTGEGIVDAIDRDFTSLDAEWMKGVAWEEQDVFGDYRIACCRRECWE